MFNPLRAAYNSSFGAESTEENTHNNNNNASNTPSNAATRAGSFSRRNHRNNNKDNNSTSNNNSTNKKEDNQAKAELAELDHAFTRIESLISKQIQDVALGKLSFAGGCGGGCPCRNAYTSADATPQKHKNNKKKNKTKKSGTQVKHGAKGITDEGTPVTPTDSKNPSSSSSSRRTQNRQNPQSSRNPPSCAMARLAPYHLSDEEETVELLRRIAELVIRGEKRAASAVMASAKASASASSSSSNHAEHQHENDTEKEEQKRAEALRRQIEADGEQEAQSALFNRFLERNGLSLVVNLVSGKAFARLQTVALAVAKKKHIDQEKEKQKQKQKQKNKSKQKDAKDKHKHKDQKQPNPPNTHKSSQPPTLLPTTTTQTCHCIYLPPVSIAKQAIQSMSILFQNVCLATSLYLLLSNNLVNDLICLPLELYSVAEIAESALLLAEVVQGKVEHDKSGGTKTPPAVAVSDESDVGEEEDDEEEEEEECSSSCSEEESAGEDSSSRASSHPLPPASSSDAPHPSTTHDDTTSTPHKSTANANANTPSSTTTTTLTKNQEWIQTKPPSSIPCTWDSEDMSEIATHFVAFLKSLAVRINTETLQFYLQYPPQSKRHNTCRSTGGEEWVKMEERVEFPLYERALDFCSASHDSFVRITAMNICMNMLRLATITAEGELQVNVKEDSTEAKEEKEEQEKKKNENEEVSGLKPDENDTKEEEAVEEKKPVEVKFSDINEQDGKPPLPKKERSKEVEVLLAKKREEQEQQHASSAKNTIVHPLQLLDDDDDDDDEEEKQNENANANNQKKKEQYNKTISTTSVPLEPLPNLLKSPEANLVTVTLPLRDRASIANHVCHPNRVHLFVGPIFSRLVSMCGALEDSMEELDKGGRRNKKNSEKEDGGDKKKKKKEEEQVHKEDDDEEEYYEHVQKVLTNVQDVAYDMQDELLLLDDVMKLGLTALNEQIIEMILARYVYPMLLEPLRLCVRRSGGGESKGGKDGTSGGSTQPTSSSSDKTSTTTTTIQNKSSSSATTTNPTDGGGEQQTPATSSQQILAAMIAAQQQGVSDVSPVDVLSSLAGGGGGGGGPTQSESVFQLLSSRPAHPFSMNAKEARDLAMLALSAAAENENCEMVVSVGQESETKTLSLWQAVTEARYDKLKAGPVPAPAKTALFCLFSVLGNMTNVPLLRLIFGALFHPLAPDGSKGEVHRAKPFVLTMESADNVEESPGMPRIGIDSVSSPPRTYAFGRRKNENLPVPESSEDEENQCVFVLSPALANVVEATEDCTALVSATNPNTYRQIVLSCIAGDDETRQKNGLHRISVLTFDAAVSALHRGKGGGGVGEILFGRGPSSNKEEGQSCSMNKVEKTGGGEQSSEAAPTTMRGLGPASSLGPSECMLEVVAALCVRIISATACINGIWRVDYDFTAGHALLKVIAGSSAAREKAIRLMEYRLNQSAAFLSKLPALVHAALVDAGTTLDENGGGDSRAGAAREGEENGDFQQDLITDKIFRDNVDGEDSCILSELQRRKHPGNSENTMAVFSRGKDKFMLAVAKGSTLADACNKLCMDNAEQSGTQGGSVSGSSLDTENIVMSCAAATALSHMRLDGLVTLMKEQQDAEKANKSSESGETAKVRNLYGDSEPYLIHEAPTTDSEDEERIMAPLSMAFCSAISDEKDDENLQSYPSSGAVVRLVGRVAFPCVCEVSEASASLFTDGRACVIADGVRWQSLYLVFIGRFALLAEPVKSGPGGNGRIVTSCRLSCLTVMNDTSATGTAGSTAKRLVLRHESIDPTPPGVFVQDEADALYGGGFFVRSHMDLWFEDSSAATNAYNIFSGKILKARAKRGKRLRDAIAQMVS